jgi:hypothetical protein
VYALITLAVQRHASSSLKSTFITVAIVLFSYMSSCAPI